MLSLLPDRCNEAASAALEPLDDGATLLSAHVERIQSRSSCTLLLRTRNDSCAKQCPA